MFHEIGLFLRSLTEPEADPALRELAKIVEVTQAAKIPGANGETRTRTVLPTGT
jgi:limonene-1,2-epoxide hydrolase